MPNRLRSSTAPASTPEIGGSTTSVSGSMFQMPPSAVPKTARQRSSKEDVGNAVYAHIQALRGLGRTRVDNFEIARALGLAPEEVAAALERLTKRGVKLL